MKPAARGAQGMKYAVKVAITYHKELSIYAANAQEAAGKAEDIVMKWNNVEDVEVLEIEEDE